jgi:transposase-like protein
MDTFVKIAGHWKYLFRAVDTGGQTVDFYLSETRDREAAKCFLQRALANPDNRPPHVFDCEAIPPPFENCRRKADSAALAVIESAATRITALSPTTATLNGDYEPCRGHARQ